MQTTQETKFITVQLNSKYNIINTGTLGQYQRTHYAHEYHFSQWKDKIREILVALFPTKIGMEYAYRVDMHRS